MAASNLEVFQGGTFIFEVGGAEFTVYKKLIARSSDALLAHIENKMRESQTGRVCLQEVDEHTFGRFVEYIYTGDYNPAEPVERPASKTSRQEGASSPRRSATYRRRGFRRNASSDNELLLMRGDTGASQQALSRSSFISNKRKAAAVISNAMDESRMCDEHLEMLASPTQHKPCPPPVFNIDTVKPLATNSISWARHNVRLDYTPLYMSHAQLYVFAEKYDIRKLRNLTAARLRETIPRYLSSSPAEIVGLARHVYDNTPDRTQEVDQLRMIVTQFCATHIDTLQESAEFVSMLHDGGQFPEVLVRELCKTRKPAEGAVGSLFA
ncbi:hypothetical protein BDY17DRAFT_309405 [Neohortaea acidophila]|uniref:BTB domain-containing protein n=1 Tax=Neohortaea acidophila TaxID=245834 RepID=A0A6A6PXY6_9PEZI|nr:uncharacterized protein BDY17DRAFT_309405 [Neohortaea acidophila]KAF2484087.1 hypothetical protein BDY17DRAFT_309405 [Neohortaea acidophila]